MKMLEIKKEICKNYELFYQIVLLSALMGTLDSEEAKSDFKLVSNFFGRTFNAEYLVDEIVKICIDVLPDMKTFEDYNSLSAAETYGVINKENRFYYEIKAKAIDEALFLNFNGRNSESSTNELRKTTVKYEFYEREIFINTLISAAKSGNLPATRILALYYHLGIIQGDTEKAELHLKRGIAWGDSVSASLLSEIYKDNNNSIESEKHIRVSKYLNDVFENTKLLTSQDIEPDIRPILLFNLIKGNKEKNLNILFCDYLLNPEITEEEKREHIINYNGKNYISAIYARPRSKTIGFMAEGGICNVT